MVIILSKYRYNCFQLTAYFAYISHLGYSFDVGVNNVISLIHQYIYNSPNYSKLIYTTSNVP